MERIKLSKNEKAVLRMVAGGQGTCPADYPLHIFNAAVRSLDRKGLVHGVYEDDGNVADSRLTQDGRMYMAENPNLRNPINWGVVLSVITITISIIALFVACNNTLN